MNTEASYITAILTGAWTVLGMGTGELFLHDWIIQFGEPVYHWVTFGLMIIFFVIPVPIYVIGKQHIHIGWFRKSTMNDFPQLIARMFCWFLSAGAFGVIYYGAVAYVRANT